MKGKNDGQSELSSAGSDSDSGSGRKRASWAWWAGWHAAARAETSYGCKVENLALEACETAYREWLGEAETGD